MGLAGPAREVIVEPIEAPAPREPEREAPPQRQPVEPKKEPVKV